MRTTRATTFRTTVAALAACGAWPLALDAQELAQAPPALDGSVSTSPRADLRRTRDAFIDIRDYSAALTPAQTVVEAQREQRDAAYPADLAALGLIQAELRATDDALNHLVAA